MKHLTQSENSIIRLDHDGGRAFEYTLNKKRAKAKLLKGAKRENHLDVEFKSGCANLRFSNGSYFKLILPLLRNWFEEKDNIIKIDDTDIEVIEVEAGRESLGQHMDTKLVVMVNGDRLVLHAYNGTQNLMIQGKNYKKFASNCLEPFFRQKIEENIEMITHFNDEVKDSLGEKKPSKISAKPFSCPQCGVKASTIGDLKLHTKRCHTKPALDSPKRKKSIKIMEEDISIMDESGLKSIQYDNYNEGNENQSNEKEKIFVPEVENLITCDFCEQDMIDQASLSNHMKSIHNYGDSIDLAEKVSVDIRKLEHQMIPPPQIQSISIC